ncbi:uncharacterized protein LOC124420123 [Lucilia cuprina]|uniref:uncharacterized protein LOC124420123 n=1 Tax=Lucilia cuprina TaxID=7375 RepID=UPI001F055E07|nr:uncharacterized protein LOC124420123 [Lucilia cuprina]
MPHQRRRSVSPLEDRNRRQHNPSHKRQQRTLYDCRLCRQDHPLRKCIKFKAMNVSEKLKVVKRYQYCENCLGHSHLIASCRNSDRCRQCQGKHHTLLHRHKRLNEPLIKNQPAPNMRSITLFPTVIVKMELGGKFSSVRGLLNPCVEVSSIASFLVDRHKLIQEKIGSDLFCKIKFRSRLDENTTFNVLAMVVNDLPRKQPKEKIDSRVTSLYTNLRLADPYFFANFDINFVLGADIYPRLIRANIQPESVGTPMAQDTVLGWTIIGRFGI